MKFYLNIEVFKTKSFFRAFSIVGLFLAVVGSGCIKSNLNAFGGNQFKLPEQSEKLSQYFSIQYFCLKCGSTLARATFPILREDVKCFGMNDCYPFAFLLPAIAMLAAFWIFVAGKKTYVQRPPSGNMFAKVIACVLVGTAKNLKFIKI